MSASLELALREHAAGLKAAGIEIRVESYIMLPPGDTAVKIKRGENSSYYSKLFRDAIAVEKQRKAAERAARQTSLL